MLLNCGALDYYAFNFLSDAILGRFILNDLESHSQSSRETSPLQASLSIRVHAQRWVKARILPFAPLDATHNNGLRKDAQIPVTSAWLPSAILQNLQFPTLFPPQGQRIQSIPLYSPTYSPGWPGVLPLGQADDMCHKNLPNNQGREKSTCDNFFATKQQVNPALSLNLMVLTLGIQLGFWRKNTDTTGTNVAGTARCDFAKILAAEAKKKKKIERRLH